MTAVVIAFAIFGVSFFGNFATIADADKKVVIR